jgi:hypothetical protein
MIVFLAIAYALISCLFMLLGYVTTARDRLHLGLSLLASALWPVSLLVVAGYVCGRRLTGFLSRHSGLSDEGEGAPETIATRSRDDIGRRIRQPATRRAGN